jgi:hypothetical protein
VANPEDQVHDRIIGLYHRLESAWLEVGADEGSRGT